MATYYLRCARVNVYIRARECTIRGPARGIALLSVLVSMSQPVILSGVSLQRNNAQDALFRGHAFLTILFSVIYVDNCYISILLSFSFWLTLCTPILDGRHG